MVRMIVVSLAMFSLVGCGGTAAPAATRPDCLERPGPDPHPSAAKGCIRYQAYEYLTVDKISGRKMRCRVPVSGPRRCWFVR
jgi:hypothetical protein